MCTALFCLSLAFLGVSESAIDRDACLQLVNRAVEARQTIRTGEMTIVVRSESSKMGAKLRTFHVWFDGAKLRVDELEDAERNPPIWSKYVFTGDEYMDYVGTASKEEEPFPLEVKTDKSRANVIFDPRKAGMMPVPFLLLRSTNWTDLYSSAAIAQCEKTATSTDGKVELRFTMSKGQRVSMGMDPKKSYAVESLTMETRHQGKEIGYESTIHYPPKAISGVWFPNRIDFGQSIGGVKGYRETIEISKVKFNHAIDSAVFTPAGMGVPLGVSVVDYPPHKEGSRIWNGKAIVSRVHTELPSVEAEWSFVNVWTIAGLLLATIAVIALIAARRVRPAA